MSYLTYNWPLKPLTDEFITSLLTTNNNTSSNNMYYTLVNPIKKDGVITAKYKVAGYEKNDIKIELTPLGTLTVDRYLTVIASNSEYGTITYKSTIPRNINEKLTKANLKNGILTLTFVEEVVKSSLANLKIEVD